jgi:hypothetical protein
VTFVRNLLSDLVARRLWPIAVVLLVALVAVPVVLSSSAPEVVEAPPAAAPAAPPAAITVTEEQDTRGGKAPIGLDPFRRPAERRPAPSVAPALPSDPTAGPGLTPDPTAFGAGAPASGGGVSLPSGLEDIDVVPVDSAPVTDETAPAEATPDQGAPTPAEAPSAPAPVADTPATPSTPAGENLTSYHVDVRFGTPGATTERLDLERLAALPSAANPQVQYLGVAADGRTALFLPGAGNGASVSGDGRCTPAPAECRRLELSAGQKALLEVAAAGGRTETVELEVVRVAAETAPSPGAAMAARGRESATGRLVLRQAVSAGRIDVSGLAYSRRLGLVLPSGARAASTAALFGGYRVDLQFGAPGALVKRYNLARLTPLPSTENPTLVFLGVLVDGQTALFLNPSEAAAAGDGVCEPSPEECQRVKLRAGQNATFTAPAIDGSTAQYALQLDGISPVHAATPADAEASRLRESPAGRVILRRLVEEVGALVSDLTFAGGRGVIEPAENAG